MTMKYLLVPLIILCPLSLADPGDVYSQDAPAGHETTAIRRISDEEISKMIKDDFSSDPILDVPIRIDVQDGIVMLQGTVEHLLVRDYASRWAESIRGVKAIINQLKVDPNPRPDQAIADDVTVALRADPITDQFSYQVEVDHGVVSVSGEVNSRVQKQLTEEVIKNIPGVRDIQNNLQIVYAQNHSDEDIMNQVRSRIALDPYLNTYPLHVRVDGGQVFLSGEVAGIGRQRMAAAKSWVLGVRDVDASRIKVNPDLEDRHKTGEAARISDEELEKNVEAAIQYDPRVSDENLDVEVDSGIAVLRGSVRTLSAGSGTIRSRWM